MYTLTTHLKCVANCFGHLRSAHHSRMPTNTYSTGRNVIMNLKPGEIETKREPLRKRPDSKHSCEGLNYIFYIQTLEARTFKPYCLRAISNQGHQSFLRAAPSQKKSCDWELTRGVVLFSRVQGQLVYLWEPEAQTLHNGKPQKNSASVEARTKKLCFNKIHIRLT